MKAIVSAYPLVNKGKQANVGRLAIAGILRLEVSGMTQCWPGFGVHL
nr:hypothetical protein [Trichocoleus desertorum]